MYVINEWDERYEVNNRGRVFKPGDTKRAGPLDYIRMPVFGLKVSAGSRRLRQLVGDDRFYEVFGIFCKCLEMAGDQPAERRNGTLYNDKDQPASIEDIAFLLITTVEQAEYAMTALVNNGWILSRISLNKEIQYKSIQYNTRLPENPGNSGKSGKGSQVVVVNRDNNSNKREDGLLSEKAQNNAQKLCKGDNGYIMGIPDPLLDPAVAKLQQLINMTEFNRVLRLGKHRDWLVSLLRKWDYSHIESAISSMNDYYQKKGIPIPTDPNLKPKIWEWIERHRPGQSPEDRLNKAAEAIYGDDES